MYLMIEILEWLGVVASGDFAFPFPIYATDSQSVNVITFGCRIKQHACRDMLITFVI